jgi:hypothetical protein
LQSYTGQTLMDHWDRLISSASAMGGMGDGAPPQMPDYSGQAK